MIWFCIIIFLLLLAVGLFRASWSVSWGVYVKMICRLDSSTKEVVISFDDGPDPEITPRLLDLLKKYDTKACFFCIGRKAEQSPSIIRRMAEEGHLIGNHSYSHQSSFPLYGKRRIKDDLLKAQKVLEEAAGHKVKLFRPPFGVTNPDIAHAIKELGLTPIGWSVRSQDTQMRTADEVFRRIKRKVNPGVIILLHDRMPFCVELTEKLLLYLKDNGYKVVLPIKN